MTSDIIGLTVEPIVVRSGAPGPNSEGQGRAAAGACAGVLGHEGPLPCARSPRSPWGPAVQFPSTRLGGVCPPCDNEPGDRARGRRTRAGAVPGASVLDASPPPHRRRRTCSRKHRGAGQVRPRLPATAKFMCQHYSGRFREGAFEMTLTESVDSSEAERAPCRGGPRVVT